MQAVIQAQGRDAGRNTSRPKGSAEGFRERETLREHTTQGEPEEERGRERWAGARWGGCVGTVRNANKGNHFLFCAGRESHQCTTNGCHFLRLPSTTSILSLSHASSRFFFRCFPSNCPPQENEFISLCDHINSHASSLTIKHRLKFNNDSSAYVHGFLSCLHALLD